MSWVAVPLRSFARSTCDLPAGRLARLDRGTEAAAVAAQSDGPLEAHRVEADRRAGIGCICSCTYVVSLL